LHGSGGVTYQWTPTNVLNNPFTANPIANIEGTTEFVLTAIDDIGCTDDDNVIIKTADGPQIYVPNAFTPNGDGLNDVFRPTYIGVKKVMVFAVYNRYGEKVFETHLPNKGWNGKYKGEDQRTSSFVWYVRALDKNGNVIEKKGNMVLIR
jgi:gliding motility-associated-like protein